MAGAATASTPDPFPLAECDGTIPARFVRWAREHPQQIAVRAEGGLTSYGELAARSHRVSHALLRARGAREEAVALLVGKHAGTAAAFLGVLGAGRIHVALDPHGPADRNRFLLEDSGAGAIVCDGGNAALARALAGPGRPVIDVDALDLALPVEDPALPLSGDTLGTILYTSGSTGRPKGVLQNHRGTLVDVRNMTRNLALHPADRVGGTAGLGVLPGPRDLLAPLLNGATYAPFDLAANGIGAVAAWLRREEVTVVNMVVTVFRHFVATLAPDERFPLVRVVKMGSEAIAHSDVAALRRHFGERCVGWVGFGTTETGNTTQLLLRHDLELPPGAIAVGPALEGKEIRILDEAGAVLPPGEVGELVVRSRYIALGYWRQPELTASVFRPDPEGGDQRCYHTGDLARLRPDGGLEHLGRRDALVKIRGQRVELGEVELALLALPGVKQAVAAAVERTPGDRRLVAYVAPARWPGRSPVELRDALQATLPAHMVPWPIAVLPALPSTAQGKVDRRGLPAPDWTGMERAADRVEARTPLEREVATIWAEVLGLDAVGVTDSFLDLGGDSLLAGRVTARVVEQFQVPMAATALLAAATVEDMAALIMGELLGLVPGGPPVDPES